jgi:hypothetical protein
MLVIIKGAIVSLHAPKVVSRKATRVHCTNRNPEPPKCTYFALGKGAEVPDLNAQKLCEMGFQLTIPHQIDISRSK